MHEFPRRNARPMSLVHRGLRRVSRREFLGGLAGLSGLAGEVDQAQLTQKYLIGCYTRPWDALDLERALDGVAEAGYRWVGLMTAKDFPGGVVTPETSEKEAGGIEARARQRGLGVCSVYGHLPAAATWELRRRQLRRCIDNCVACGCRELLLGGADDPGDEDRYYRAVADACDYAQTFRVGLTIKPHGKLNATGAACRAVIERVQRANFRLWYDPGNVLYYSEGRREPLRDVLDVDGLVVGMSVKDFRPPREVDVTPGTGVVNFPALFARLRLGGFTRGQLLVECTARGDYRQVTAEAAKARLFVERLARGRALEGLQPKA